MQDAASNELLAKCCLGYLLQFDRSDSVSEESIKEFKLAEYSAEFWISHAKAAVEGSATLSQPMMELLWTRNEAYLNWIRISDPDRLWRGSDFTQTLESVPAPLYYTSQAGLAEITSLLLSKGEVDINAEGGVYGNALQAASFQGHGQIVEMLLSKGAEVNAEGGFYGNALQAASLQGHDKVVELLLSNGADVNLGRGRHYGNPLQAAAIRGHAQIVMMLLSKGVDVNAEEGLYGSALQAASIQGHGEVVELLLSKGADVNIKGGYYGNALQGALSQGHRRIVELLFRAGARLMS